MEIPTQKNAGILGLGKYLPERVLTNADLEKLVDTSDEWIMQRTGISERRLISGDETTTSMAIAAARAALEDAGVPGDRIGLVVVATASPDYYSPATASLVQHAIGAEECAALDINVGCAGSTYAFVLAENYIKSGACDYALVVGAETLSRFVDFTDRKTCILFGDGAGAAVLGKVPDGYGMLSSYLRSDGREAESITIPGLTISDVDIERRGGKKQSTVWLDGSKVMKFATRALAKTVKEIADRAGIAVPDIDLVVPHQANIRIVDGGMKRLEIDPDRVFVNIHKYGNTSAASVLIALCEAAGEGRIKDGSTVAIVAFGAGLTYGGALFKWHK